VNTQEGASRNGFVSRMVRFERSPNSSRNDYRAAKEDETATNREPIIAVRRGSAGRHPWSAAWHDVRKLAPRETTNNLS